MAPTALSSEECIELSQCPSQSKSDLQIDCLTAQIAADEEKLSSISSEISSVQLQQSYLSTAAKQVASLGSTAREDTQTDRPAELEQSLTDLENQRKEIESSLGLSRQELAVLCKKKGGWGSQDDQTSNDSCS